MPAFDSYTASSTATAAGPTIGLDSTYHSFYHHQPSPTFRQPLHHILKHFTSQSNTVTTGIGITTTATTGAGTGGGAVGVIGGGSGGGGSGATTFGGTTYYGDGVSAGGSAGGVMSGYGGPLGGNGVSNHGGVALPAAFAAAYGMQPQPDGLGSALGGGGGHHSLGSIGLGGFVGPHPPPPHLSGLGMPGVSTGGIGLGGALGGGGGGVLGSAGWGNAGTTPERVANNRPRRSDRSSYQQQQQLQQHPSQHQTPSRLDHRFLSSVFNNNNNLLQSTPIMDRSNAILSGHGVGGIGSMSVSGGGTRRRVIDEDGYGNFGDGDGHNQHSAFPNSLSSIQTVGSVNSSSHLHSEPNHVHHSYHQVHDSSLDRCRNTFLKNDDSGSNTNSGGTFASSTSSAEHAKKPKWEVLEIVGKETL